MDPLILVLIAAFFGFLILAFVLLYPVYRFLDKEEEVSKRWTRERLNRSVRGEADEPAGDGTKR